ncbi:hypothetical protein ACYCFK_14855 [Stutzerimonas stutzeri]
MAGLTAGCLRLPDGLAAIPARPDVAFHTLVGDKLLTEAPFAAALTAPLSSRGNRSHYENWLGLIVLCCCQLYVKGDHDSAIYAALREIRLIATNAKHSPILTLLPHIDGCEDLEELSELLQTKRNNSTDLIGVQRHGLAYLSVVVHSCATDRSGIKRNRRYEVTQPDQGQPVEAVVANQIDPGFDGDLTLERLERVDAAAGDLDEPPQTTAAVTLRYNDPSLRNKELALKALQGRRLAEQFATQQNSLRCAYDQATEFDISHLVSHCLEQLARGDELAGWMLVSLLTGRDITRLIEPTQTTLSFIKEHPCLLLTHQVPAGHQPENLNDLLPPVIRTLPMPLPHQLGPWLKSLRPGRPPPDASAIRAWLKVINQTHGTRLAPGMIARYLKHWQVNRGGDNAVIALLRGESHKTRPALSYAQQKPAKVLNCYYKYVEAVFGMATEQPQLPPLRDTPSTIGSRLHLPPKVLHNAFSLLAKRIASNQSTLNFHNDYVVYVWALLVFATGHRDVNAPMGLLTDYNPYQRSWWISDKERRQGLSARTVIIPKTAALQIDLYLDHLRNLARYHRLLNPAITERCQQALAGQANLLFGFVEKDGTALPCDLTPTLVTSLLNGHLPWARNWARHHLRSELANRNVNPELIDGWMGHEEIGEEAVGRHSSVSMSQFRGLAEVIESILTEHKIEAVAGWQTH